MPDDPVSIWLRLDKVLRRIIAHRMKHGRSPENDHALDELRATRDRAARGITN